MHGILCGKIDGRNFNSLSLYLFAFSSANLSYLYGTKQRLIFYFLGRSVSLPLSIWCCVSSFSQSALRSVSQRSQSCMLKYCNNGSECKMVISDGLGHIISYCHTLKHVFGTIIKRRLCLTYYYSIAFAYFSITVIFNSVYLFPHYIVW